VVPLVLPTPYPIGPVTTYLLRGEPLTLVDTGPATAAAWHALVAALEQLGLRPADVRRVLVTHGHHDHFGQAQRLARRGAELWAHDADADNLRLRRRLLGLWRELTRAALPLSTRVTVVVGLLLLDRTALAVRRFSRLEDGQILPLDRAPLRVLHLPGHSPGHVGLEISGEGVVLGGDLLLDGITPNAIVGPDPRDPSRPFLSLAAYNASLERLQGLQARLLLPAHGPCIRDISGQVASVLARQAERAAQVISVLERGGTTVASLLRRLFPGLSSVATFLAFSEVYGHLLELERRGETRRVSAGRHDRWVLAR